MLDVVLMTLDRTNHLETVIVLSQQTFLVFQDFFSVTLFVLQDVLKTSSSRLQDVFAIHLPKTSSRRLQDVFKTSSRRLPRRLQDVFARRLAVMSSRRLWRQKNVTLKTSSRRPQDVFSTSSPRGMFPGILVSIMFSS